MRGKTSKVKITEQRLEDYLGPSRYSYDLQIGTTNGGNDGSVFAEWGVPDVPIGWPLRYSHSPVEVLDLRDVAGLADLVLATAVRW